MSKFKEKVEKMKFDLANIQFGYGYYSKKAVKLREKIEIYEKVAKMSHQEVGDRLAYAAGEIEKLKSGYYYYATSVDKERKLLNVLRERIKSDNKDTKDEIKTINNTSLDMIGCTIEDKEKGGFIDG